MLTSLAGQAIFVGGSLARETRCLRVCDETFRELNFRGLRPIRENRENYTPQKFGAIR